MFTKAFKDLIDGLRLYKVWTYQAWHETSAKYKRTVLGSLWIAGTMVTISLALALIYGALLGHNLKDVLPHIMAGIMCYNMASFMLGEAPEIFMKSSFIIRSHAYPFTYYVLESAASNFIIFLNNAIVFYISMALLGTLAIPNWTILLGLPIVFVTITSWGTVIALLASRFRDLRFMMPHLSQIIYFLTPIMWQVSDISAKNRSRIADINPFYGLVEILRAPLLGHEPPGVCWALALVTMFTGIFTWIGVFGVFRRRIPFWV